MPCLPRRNRPSRQRHSILQAVRATGYNKQCSCVHEHKVQDGREMRGDIISRCEQRLERLRILRWRPAFDVIKRVRGQAKVLRAERSLTYAAVVKELPRMRIACARNFVQAFGSTNDKGTPYARGPEGGNKGRAEGDLRNSEDHATGPRRVKQRAQDVE